jgi:plasmid maintenance system antidote protein VapI
MSRTRPMRPPRYPEVAAEMARRGFTNRNLAPLVGITDNYLSRIIIGREPLTARVRDDVARILGRPVNELWAEPSGVSK